jgi:GntR family transcriptional regulator
MADKQESNIAPGSAIRQDSVLPKYYQLKHILREWVTQVQPGDLVPSEAELCQQYSVSRTTVRKALSDLAQEGLVYTIQGKGTFTAGAKKRSGWVAQTGGLHADLTERGSTVTMHVLEKSLIPAEENIARELMIAEGAPVLKLVRLRFVDGKSFDICTNYLSQVRYPEIEKQDFERTSLYTVLRGKYNVKFTNGVRLIEAGSCNSDEAKLLQIPANSPLLVMRSTMYDEDGITIEHGVVRQRSDVSQIIINVIAH